MPDWRETPPVFGWRIFRYHHSSYVWESYKITQAHMKIFMLYVVFIFISTCLSDIHVLPGFVTEQWRFCFLLIFRTGWPSCLFTSPCSRNTAQSIFQTLSHQEPGTITLSAGSVLLISCCTSKLSFSYTLTYLTCAHSFICLFRTYLLAKCTRMPQVYLFQRITLPVGEAWIQCTTP